jgi:hypothetical protein
MVVNPKFIRAFASEAAFETWLSEHHDRQKEVWIKIFKRPTGQPTVTPAQAIDVALCWGWIDGIRKTFDERAFLQRFTPRGPKSRWSQINRGNVQRLVEAGRMKPAGQRHVDAAKGRRSMGRGLRLARQHSGPAGRARGHSGKPEGARDISFAQSCERLCHRLPHAPHQDAGPARSKARGGHRHAGVG